MFTSVHPSFNISKSGVKVFIDPEKNSGNRYKQIKSIHPRFKVYWCDVFTT